MLITAEVNTLFVRLWSHSLSTVLETVNIINV